MKSMKFVKFAAVIAALSLVGIALPACTGNTKAGTKYTQLPNRALQAVFSGDLETVHNRAAAVLKDDFHYTITKDKKDALEGIIEAKTAKDELVKVETYKQGDKTTKVVVYAGFLKSADQAEKILSAIEDSLPSSK